MKLNEQKMQEWLDELKDSESISRKDMEIIKANAEGMFGEIVSNSTSLSNPKISQTHIDALERQIELYQAASRDAHDYRTQRQDLESLLED